MQDARLKEPAYNGAQIAFAFILYTALSILFFGIPILTRFSHTYIGGGVDPICQIWAIAWWPYAIAHRVNPLITRALWAPVGYNLVWATATPGPSLIIYPITRYFGPVVSYNVLCLIAPPAAASSAFLLCRYIGGRFWPALGGGYIFGFSPYMLCHILAHLAFILIFPIPLLVYTTLLRIDRWIGRAGFVTAMLPLLLFQFLCSTEIFATATLFGTIALFLAFILVDRAMRSNLIGIAIEIACAYGILAVLLAPFLYYVFAGGLPTPLHPASAYSNDLLTFILPPPVLFIAPHRVGATFGHFFETAPWWEQAAYLGPGLGLLIALFAWSFWQTQCGKFLLINLAVVAIMSLGPLLHCAGNPLIAMPWRLFNLMPLMDEALPGRFGMYFFLVAAVIATIYLARASTAFWWWKAVLVSLSLLFILPKLATWGRVGRTPAYLATPGLAAPAQSEIRVPEFFRSDQYKRFVAPGDNLLILPLGLGSNPGLLWQAQSDFYFNIISWYGAIYPPDAERWPVMAALHSGSGNKIFDFTEQLDAFLGAHQVKAIVVDPSAGIWAEQWPDLLARAGMTALARGGVLFYKVPAQVLVSFRNATPDHMAEREAHAAGRCGVIRGPETCSCRRAER